MAEAPVEEAQTQPAKENDISNNGSLGNDPKLEAGPKDRPSLGKTGRRLSNLPKRGLDQSRFLSMRIPNQADAEHTAEETHGYGHWKVKLLAFLHSDRVETALMLLLLVDVLLLFIELFLQASYPMCHIIERDAISCCPINATTDHATAGMEEAEHGEDEHHFLRFLASEEHGGHHNLCASSTVESYQYEATCDPHKWGNVHTLEEFLFWCTITILSVFFIELIAMVFVLGRPFFQQFFYVLDLFIVSTSLVLEVAFHLIDADTLMAITGILVFGRVWRFVRIGHGLVEVTSEYAGKDKKLLLDYAESLEKLLQDNNIDLPEKHERVQCLEEHHTSHGHHSGEHGN